ncbi:hypothetical protein U1Q18_029074, partial [Sarracenia purpurea var. burkii]
ALRIINPFLRSFSPANMEIRSWLPTCSSNIVTSTAAAAPTPPPETLPPKLLYSDTSSGSDMPGIRSSSTSSSLHTDLSLQTLPSVPSLQKLSAETLHLSLSVTHHHVASLKPRPLQAITFLATHHNLLYAAAGNEIHVFDADNHSLVDIFNNKDSSSGSVKSVTFKNGRIFSGHQDCKIRVWKLTASKQHRLVSVLPTVKDRLRHFIFPTNYVNVRRHRKRLWIEHHDAVAGLAVTDGFLCSVSWDKCLKIWRVSDFKCTQSVIAHDDAINAVAVSSDGTIYTASVDHRIKVWGRRRSTGEKKHVLIATLEKHKSAVNALALNGDGTVLFSGACDRSILVWEREDTANYMAVTGALRGHSKAILCLINVSELLFSGSADRTVRIWRRGHDGRFCCLTVSDSHEKPVKSLAAVPESEGSIPNGRGIKVFSGSFDGEIKVWRVVVSDLNNNPSCSDLHLVKLNSLMEKIEKNDNLD